MKNVRHDSQRRWRARVVSLAGVLVAVGAAAGSAGSGQALGAGVTQTVALTGEQAPGTASGVDFSSFSNPVLDDAGQVAFRSFLTGSDVDSSNDEGIWRGGPGSLSLVARAGSQAPGTASGAILFGTPFVHCTCA